MQSTDDLIRNWRDARSAVRFYPAMTFVTRGLVLGSGTTIARFTNDGKSKLALDLEGKEEAVRELIEQALRNATPEDIGASYEGRKVIAGAVFLEDPKTGEKIPSIVGTSGTIFKTPSVQTNVYVVIVDEGNKVINCYPINPTDEVNPRAE